MKRTVTLVIALVLVLCMTGCGNKDNTVNPEAGNEVVETTNDFMDKYISKLESNQDRTNFLNFWNAMTSYCSGLEYELDEMSNTESYTFDPTKSDNIPEILKNKYDFASIKFFDGFDKHSGFKMTIEGENVSLEFDGEEFYPTNYGYSEVQSLVNKHNGE